MSETEKSKYVKRAKSFNAFKQLEKEAKEITDVYQMDKGRNTEEKIESLKNYVQNALSNNTLLSDHFFFVSVNYFNHTKEGDFYVPAEISISKFSLKSGLIDVYHTLINPGEIPCGYKYGATFYSNSTHCLPVPPNALGNSDYTAIYKCILKFIMGDKVTIIDNSMDEEVCSNNITSIKTARNFELPEIFTKTEQMEILKSILDTLCSVEKDGAIISGGSLLTIQSIQYLLYNVKLCSAEITNIEPPKNIHIVDLFFRKDPYEYESNIACDYHEECDRSNYCTRSIVTRWVYMFCGSVCKDFEIEPLPGKHLPAKDKKTIIYANVGLYNSSDILELSGLDSEEKENSHYIYIDNFSEERQTTAPEVCQNYSSPQPEISTDNTSRMTSTPPTPVWNIMASRPETSGTSNLSISDFPAIGSRGRRSPPEVIRRDYARAIEVSPQSQEVLTSANNQSSENIMEWQNNIQTDIQQQNHLQYDAMASAGENINRSMQILDSENANNEEAGNRSDMSEELFDMRALPRSWSDIVSSTYGGRRDSGTISSNNEIESIMGPSGRGAFWQARSHSASNNIPNNNRGPRGRGTSIRGGFRGKIML